jgi:hypothetical protein
MYYKWNLVFCLTQFKNLMYDMWYPDRPTDRRLSAKLVQTFADRVCHVVSVMAPYGRILSFPDRSRYFFFQVAPQLYWGKSCMFSCEVSIRRLKFTDV